MRTRLNPITIVAMLAMMLFGVGVGQASPARQVQAAIRLKAATFVPALGQAPAISERLAITGYAASQRGYFLVQFRGPVEQAWKDQVAVLGAELIEYVPDYAFKVRMSPAQARQVGGLSDVAWVGLFHPAYKLDPALMGKGAQLYHVMIERGADAGAASADIARAGVTVLGGSGSKLLVAADSAQLEAIAKVLDVAWVENFKMYEKHNEYGGSGIIGGGVANTRGYNGSTQIAAVSDTGLGGGTAATAHPDIPAGRIVQIRNWPGTAGGCFQTIVNDGAKDVDSGHGTHTAGSVLSDGGAAGEGTGVAPAASLVFQATENYATITPICTVLNPGLVNGYYLTGIPDDLRTHFQQAYTDGAAHPLELLGLGRRRRLHRRQRLCRRVRVGPPGHDHHVLGR